MSCALVGRALTATIAPVSVPPTPRRKRSRYFMVAVVVALLLAVVGFVTAARPAAGQAYAQQPGSTSQTDQLLLVQAELERNESVDVVVMFDVAEAVSRFGGPPANQAQFSRAQLVRLARDGVHLVIDEQTQPLTEDVAFVSVPAMVVTLTAQAQLEALVRSPLVRSVTLEDDGGTILTDDTRQIIGADISWAGGIGGSGVRIAVLDTGIDSDHPDLADAIVHEACFITNDDGTPGCNGKPSSFEPGAGEDDNGHGTVIAGIVASQGVVGPRGIAPDVELEAIKMIDSFGIFSSSSQMTQALDYVLSSRFEVDVVNISAGTSRQFPGSCDADFPAMAAAVDALRARGTMVVAAAANTGSATMGAPACLSGVVAVGATFDNRAYAATFDTYAAFSSITSMTDVAAPGSTINASAMGGGVAEGGFGTSLAVAAVSGCIALFIDQGYSTVSDIEDRIQTSPHFVGRAGHSVPRIDCSPLIMNQPGDITCDGRMNDNDTVAVLEYLVGSRTSGGACPLESTVTRLDLSKADADGDTAVRLVDALMLAQN